MPEARHQVVIRRPASEVFGFIADGSTGRSGGPGSWTSPTLRERGRRDLQTGRQGSGRSPHRRVYRVTAYEPYLRLAFEAIVGPVRPTGEYLLEELDAGRV